MIVFVAELVMIMTVADPLSRTPLDWCHGSSPCANDHPLSISIYIRSSATRWYALFEMTVAVNPQVLHEIISLAGERYVAGQFPISTVIYCIDWKLSRHSGVAYAVPVGLTTHVP